MRIVLFIFFAVISFEAKAQVIAEAIEKNYNCPNAVPDSEALVSGDKNICANQNFQYAITNALSQVGAEVLTFAHSLAIKVCWPKIKSATLKVFDAESDATYFLDYFCSDLGKFEVSNDMQKQKCSREK
jgi:hypothetical protein